jgi:threonine/homoserine/homoserine lactone efflux protein
VSVGKALGDVLPIAVAVAIFPVPIIAVVLLLGSDHGARKGLAFVLAWFAGLGTVGTVALAAAGVADATSGGEPATWVNVVLLGLGGLLLALAIKQWRGRPRGDEETAMPGWMRTIDDFTTIRAAGAGFALTALNPKNVMLAVAAAAEIAEAGLSAGREIAVLAAFVVFASAGVISPLVVSLAIGDRSRPLLDGLRGWMARYSAVIMTVLFLLIGAKLIGDAISGLSS